MRIGLRLAGLAGLAAVSFTAFGQSAGKVAASVVSSPMPRVVEKDGRWALMVDGEPYLMLGMQLNNSSAWPGVFDQVWPAVDRLHANTIEAPIYWEQMEPVQGKFDFSVVDALLASARAHKVHLVLLWFGTWKNGSPHYVPEWMKSDPVKYPMLVDAKGMVRDTMSPYGAATLEADTRAFAALMRHLKAADARHTVLMVQVENEINQYGTSRDYSAEAVKAYAGAVPEELVKALHTQEGTWEQVFGAEASDTFQTWSIARYVEQVVKAGKAEDGLPMYLNHSLGDAGRPAANGRLSGEDQMNHALDIWKATAPSLDLISPDIYMTDYARYMHIVQIYGRKDNALFIPETTNSALGAKFLFAAVGHGAIGWSPFGLDLTGYSNAPLGAPLVDEKLIDLFALNYKLLGPMAREIAKLNFDGKVQAVAEDPAVHTQSLEFGPWSATVVYGLKQFGATRNPPGNADPVGRALVAQLGPDEFLVTGVDARVDFRPTDAAGGKHREWVRVEEGQYVDGRWKFVRIWNGDQTDYGLNFTESEQVLRVKVGEF
jgi:beta-galactosidase GanA